MYQFHYKYDDGQRLQSKEESFLSLEAAIDRKDEIVKQMGDWVSWEIVQVNLIATSKKII